MTLCLVGLVACGDDGTTPADAGIDAGATDGGIMPEGRAFPVSTPTGVMLVFDESGDVLPLNDVADVRRMYLSPDDRLVLHDTGRGTTASVVYDLDGNKLGDIAGAPAGWLRDGRVVYLRDGQVFFSATDGSGEEVFLDPSDCSPGRNCDDWALSRYFVTAAGDRLVSGATGDGVVKRIDNPLFKQNFVDGARNRPIFAGDNTMVWNLGTTGTFLFAPADSANDITIFDMAPMNRMAGIGVIPWVEDDQVLIQFSDRSGGTDRAYIVMSTDGSTMIGTLDWLVSPPFDTASEASLDGQGIRLSNDRTRVMLVDDGVFKLVGVDGTGVETLNTEALQVLAFDW